MKIFVTLPAKACLLLIAGCIFCYRAPAQTVDAKIPYAAIGSLSPDTDTRWLEDVFDKNITDSVQIVGLGEVSHGGIEPMNFQVKMIQYLVEKKGYRNVFIEFPDYNYIRLIREYLNSNNLQRNTIENLVKKFGTTSAIEQKLLTLFNWIKKYNLGNPTDMVQVAGFDLSSDLSFFNYVLNNYITPLNHSEGTEYAYQLNDVSDTIKLKRVRSWFDSNRKLIAKRFTKSEVEWLNFHLANLENGIKEYLMKDGSLRDINNEKSSRFRDSIMVENVKYLARSKKTALIAHNLHLRIDNDGRMGQHLDKYYYSQYYVILTDFSGKATVEIDPKIEPVQNRIPYISKSFTPDPTTAPVEIMQKFGIASGIFQHEDILRFRVLDRINNIDRYGVQFISLARKKAFNTLVVFDTVTPGKSKPSTQH